MGNMTSFLTSLLVIVISLIQFYCYLDFGNVFTMGKLSNEEKIHRESKKQDT